MTVKLNTEQSAHSKTKEDYKESVRLADKRSNDLSLHYSELLNESLKQSEKQIAQSKASLASALAANNSLHSTISTLNASLSEATRSSIEEYATVSSGLLATCTERLVWYADEANGHRIDADKYYKAWPKPNEQPVN